MFVRESTRTIRIGDVIIGGGNDILVQSMTNTDTRDVSSTNTQIARLVDAGCELVRLAIPDEEAAVALASIKKATSIPIVADIHFDYRLALRALEAGVDKLRINPGNIGDEDRVCTVVKAAKERCVPIRIGVNAGSLAKMDGELSVVERMIISLSEQVEILERMDFYDIVISLKSSDVNTTIDAYRRCAEIFSYPLHLGMTEAGPMPSGLIKSSVGIGSLLNLGLGDTIRVSLTEDPVIEVESGFQILNSLGLRRKGIDIVSCPTCGRCEVDLKRIVDKVALETKKIDAPLKVAIMGCVVNGPNEASDADIGVACGKGCGLLFKNGEVISKVNEEDIVETLLREIYEMIDSK